MDKADPAEAAAPQIRISGAEEAAALTELALRSKASWGYSAEFMAACREELTFTSAKLAGTEVWAADLEDRLAGFIRLRQEGELAELEDFFVDPDRQGRGVGSALMKVFLDACRARGVRAVEVDADPHAEAIYARFGFRTVGRSPSGSIPGRWLPRMRLDLA